MNKLNLLKQRPKVADQKTCPQHTTARFALRCAPGVIIAGCMFAVALLLGGTTGIDQAFGASRTAITGAVAAPANLESCQPLLKIIRQGGTMPSAPTPAQTSPETGRVVVLGLVLGVSHVIGPKETGLEKRTPPPSRRKNIETAGRDSGQAIAIAAYRRCVSQKTLEARNATTDDWRWAR